MSVIGTRLLLSLVRGSGDLRSLVSVLLVMSGLTYDVCLVYLDDILIFSKTFDEHLDRLATVFGRLDRYALKLKPSKCSLFQRKVSFLGHVVSGRGIECDPTKVASIATWPTLTNVARCAPSAVWLVITGPSCATSRPLRDPYTI